jgi:hypothetical protein
MISYGPFHKGIAVTNVVAAWRAINWLWWIQRLPMFLLAVPAAWGGGRIRLCQVPPRGRHHRRQRFRGCLHGRGGIR